MIQNLCSNTLRTRSIEQVLIEFLLDMILSELHIIKHEYLMIKEEEGKAKRSRNEYAQEQRILNLSIFRKTSTRIK
jgi:hypothetical protein